MQKNLFLNLIGVAALSLLCACGGTSDVKHEAAQHEKHAENDVPETEAVAQVEVPTEAAMKVAEAEEPTTPATAEMQKLAEGEPQEQKA